MREGYYSVIFAGTEGFGGGILALDTGVVIGADAAGALYDGTYQHNQRTGMIDLDVVLTVPGDVTLVQGVPPQGKEWKFPIKASLPVETPSHPVRIETQFGPVNVVFKFLRRFP